MLLVEWLLKLILYFKQQDVVVTERRAVEHNDQGGKFRQVSIGELSRVAI